MILNSVNTGGGSYFTINLILRLLRGTVVVNVLETPFLSSTECINLDMLQVHKCFVDECLFISNIFSMYFT